MKARWKDGKSAKLVVLFYIDAPPLKYFAHRPSPVTPHLPQQHLAHRVPLPVSLPVADSHAHNWQRGDECVRFIN